MQLDPDWLRLLFEVFLAICAGTSAAIAWHQRKQTASSAQIAKLKLEIEELWEETRELDRRRSNTNGELKDRLKEVETAQKHMPTAMEVGALIAHVEQMQEMLAGMNHQMQTINTYLLGSKS